MVWKNHILTLLFLSPTSLNKPPAATSMDLWSLRWKSGANYNSNTVFCFLLWLRNAVTTFVFKASAHSFKQFTSRLLKSTFSLSLSMHIYNSDGRHAWFHLHGASRPARSASEATKYKMKNFLSTVGLEPTTLRFKVWCSTYWASRAWWILSI